MKRIHACLLGQWVDITEAGTVADHQSPSIYFEETLTFEKNGTIPEAFKFGYIHVQYDGKDYRIDQSCIQIVTE